MLELTDFLKIIPIWALIALVVFLVFIIQGFIAIGSFFFKDYWNNSKEKLEKHEKALLENTMAIVKLQVQLERLTDLLILVPKLKEDISFAHEKIREIQNGQ